MYKLDEKRISHSVTNSYVIDAFKRTVLARTSVYGTILHLYGDTHWNRTYYRSRKSFVTYRYFTAYEAY